MHDKDNTLIPFPVANNERIDGQDHPEEYTNPNEPENTEGIVTISIAIRIQALVRKVVTTKRISDNTLNVRIDDSKISQILKILEETIKENPSAIRSLGVSPETIGQIIIISKTLKKVDCSKELVDFIKKALIQRCKDKQALEETVSTLRILNEIYKDSESSDQKEIVQFVHEASVREGKQHIEELRMGKATALYAFFEAIESEWPNKQTFPGKTYEELEEALSIWGKDKKTERDVKTKLSYFGTSIAEISAAIRQEQITRSEFSNLLYRLIYRKEDFLKGSIISMAKEKLTEEEAFLIEENIEKWEFLRQTIMPILTACRKGNIEQTPELIKALGTLPVINNYGIPYGYVGTTKEEIEAFRRRLRLKSKNKSK